MQIKKESVNENKENIEELIKDFTKIEGKMMVQGAFITGDIVLDIVAIIIVSTVIFIK